jgi:hypothetical protein
MLQVGPVAIYDIPRKFMLSTNLNFLILKDKYFSVVLATAVEIPLVISMTNLVGMYFKIK